MVASHVAALCSFAAVPKTRTGTTDQNIRHRWTTAASRDNARFEWINNETNEKSSAISCFFPKLWHATSPGHNGLVTFLFRWCGTASRSWIDCAFAPLPARCDPSCGRPTGPSRSVQHVVTHHICFTQRLRMEPDGGGQQQARPSGRHGCAGATSGRPTQSYVRPFVA